MSNALCNIRLCKHLGIVRNNHTLSDFLRHLLPLRKNDIGKLSRFLCMVYIEWKHSKIPHGQIFHLIPHGVFSQSNR